MDIIEIITLMLIIYWVFSGFSKQKQKAEQARKGEIGGTNRNKSSDNPFDWETIFDTDVIFEEGEFIDEKPVTESKPVMAREVKKDSKKEIRQTVAASKSSMQQLVDKGYHKKEIGGDFEIDEVKVAKTEEARFKVDYKNRKKLREAIVYKEILSKPVSLRKSHPYERTTLQ